MELRRFIEQSIEEIVEGVRASAAKYGAVVAPGRIEDSPIYTERLIHFDVTVAIEEEGGGRLRVPTIAELGGDVRHARTHRVSFDVPVHLNVRDQ